MKEARGATIYIYIILNQDVSIEILLFDNLKMLLESGDLIPVKRAAVDIPWTRRKSQVQNFLHRGPVEFTVTIFLILFNFLCEI